MTEELVIQPESSGEHIREIEIDSLVPSHFHLRQVDPGFVRELARSIAHLGLLQPIVARPVSDGRFQVVFGQHRLQACKQLGLRRIKAIIRDISVDDAFLACVAENLQRNSVMDAFEEAKGYQALIERGWTQTKISQRIGKSDSYVSDRLNLIRRLHPQIILRLEDSHRGDKSSVITPSHAQRLARIKDPERQLLLANLIEDAKLSVRDLENVVKHRSARGRFYVKLRKKNSVSIPTELAERLGLAEGSILEARIRHGKIWLSRVSGISLLRLCQSAQRNH